MIELTLLWNTPSKKNWKQWTGKYLISSKWYTKRHKEISKQLQLVPKYNINSCEIEITIYPDSMRKWDLTNKAESVMDVLVDLGILADDNWYVCWKVVLFFGGKDKENPRALVKIKDEKTNYRTSVYPSNDLRD